MWTGWRLWAGAPTIQSMDTVNITAERFGTQAPKPTPSAYAPSHRARRIQSLSEELMQLTRHYMTAGEVERASLADQRAIQSKQLLTLRKEKFQRRRHRIQETLQLPVEE